MLVLARGVFVLAWALACLGAVWGFCLNGCSPRGQKAVTDCAICAGKRRSGQFHIAGRRPWRVGLAAKGDEK